MPKDEILLLLLLASRPMLSSDVKALFQHSVHADVARTAAVRQILLVRQCNVGSNPTHTTHNNVAD